MTDRDQHMWDYKAFISGHNILNNDNNIDQKMWDSPSVTTTVHNYELD